MSSSAFLPQQSLALPYDFLHPIYIRHVYTAGHTSSSARRLQHSLHQLQHAQVALRIGGDRGAAGPRPAEAADKLLAARQPRAPRHCMGMT